MRLDAYEQQLSRRHARAEVAYAMLVIFGLVLLITGLTTFGFWLDVQWIRWAAER